MPHQNGAFAATCISLCGDDGTSGTQVRDSWLSAGGPSFAFFAKGGHSQLWTACDFDLDFPPPRQVSIRNLPIFSTAFHRNKPASC